MIVVMIINELSGYPILVGLGTVKIPPSEELVLVDPSPSNQSSKVFGSSAVGSCQQGRDAKQKWLVHLPSGND